MDALKYDLKQVIFICKRQVLLLFVCIIIEGCMTYAQPLLLTKITDQGILGKNSFIGTIFCRRESECGGNGSFAIL